MRRRIKRLVAKDFLGLRDIDLALERPVALFVGKNSQGKSSIRDAILFALTGKCRAMRKFNEAGQLARDGAAGPYSVSMTFNADGDTEASTITRTAKNISAGPVDERPALYYAMNPAAFIALPPRDRGKLLSDVLGGGMRDLIQAAITEHVGSIPDAIRAEIKGSGVDTCDVDALRAEIVRIRRDLKREIKDAPGKPPALRDFSLPDNYDVTVDEAEVKKQAARIAEAGAAEEKRKQAERDAARIKEIEAAIASLRGRIRPLPTLAGDVTAEALGHKAVYLEVLKQIVAAADGAKCECPVCGGLKPRKTMEDRRDEIAAALKDYQAGLSLHREIEAGNASIRREIEIAERELCRLRETAMPATAGLMLDLADIQARHAAAQAQIQAYRSYKAAVATFEQRRTKIEQNDALISECDRIDATLKDGGPVKAAIAAGGRQLPINQNLLKAWGMDGLRWADNGDITLRDIPIEWASESERYRAACVMGLALADVADIGFAALDGFEVLVGDNANAFFDAVLECRLNNVFVFASRSDVPAADAIPAWLDVFEVKGGEVRGI